MWQPHAAEQQEDLFPEGGSAARRRGRGAPLFPVARWTVSVSYEQLVLVAVAAILAGVVIFSLGMERGRRLAQRPVAPHPTTAATHPQTALAFAENAATPARTPVAASPVAVAAADMATTNDAPAAAKRQFTIQLATFSRTTLADEELRQLRQRGWQPFLITTGKYTALCVGDYATRQEAARHVAAFKSSYHDCFVRAR